MRNADSGMSAMITDDDATSQLEAMERRMKELDERLRVQAAVAATATQRAAEPKQDEAPVWRVAKDWKPCPIGALPSGKKPNLDLPPLVSLRDV